MTNLCRAVAVGLSVGVSGDLVGKPEKAGDADAGHIYIHTYMHAYSVIIRA